MTVDDLRIDLGIVVRDLDACLAFYRDVIGLPVVREVDRGSVRMRYLQCGPSLLKLVAPDPAPESTNPGEGILGATGMRYWTIEVDDIEAYVERCEAAGATVATPIREGITPGVRLAMVEDPEGNTLELVDRTLVDRALVDGAASA